MYSPKVFTHWRKVVLVLLVGGAFFFDVVFGTSEYPILTMLVCGIVVLYELVSPYIYTAR